MNFNKYKISVIVPVYNAHSYLSKCIDSILNQTYTNLEIILVNDCSSDDSLKICNEYAKKDKRIIVINNEENQGQATSRNIGISKSTGDYITFVDNDDIIGKKMYETLINDAIKYNCDIAGCACSLLFDNGQVINNYKDCKSELKNSDELIKKILMYSDDAWGTVWNKIFSRKLKNELIFPEGKELEDYYVLIKLYKKINYVYFNSNAFYFWYQRNGSQSKRGYHKNIRTIIEISNEIKKMLDYKQYEKEIDFFEFVNRYHVITSAYKSKNKDLYKSIYKDIKDIEKLYKKVKKIKSENRNVRLMILKLKIIKALVILKKI